MSPASPYVGLTRSLDAGQDEPDRFYPSGKRTFGRLQPGDPVQAAAQVQLMRRAGRAQACTCSTTRTRSRCRSRDLVACDATAAGIELAGHDSIATSAGAAYAGEIEKILRKAAHRRVFFAGGAGPGTVALWRALHRADPHLLLLGSSAMAREAFASQLAAGAGAGAERTYLTTPVLPLAALPAVVAARARRLRAGASAAKRARTCCTGTRR